MRSQQSTDKTTKCSQLSFCCVHSWKADRDFIFVLAFSKFKPVRNMNEWKKNDFRTDSPFKVRCVTKSHNWALFFDVYFLDKSILAGVWRLQLNISDGSPTGILFNCIQEIINSLHFTNVHSHNQVSFVGTFVNSKTNIQRALSGGVNCHICCF